METILATKSSPGQSEVRLSGRSISPGLGMGRAWIAGDVLKWSGPATLIGQDQVDGELVRLAHSYEETLAELNQYARRIEAEFDSALAGVFRAHGEMLRELFVSGEFERELRASLLTAEAVVRRVLQRWYQRFATLENQTLRQRADDVLDLGRNMIRRLRGEEEVGFKAVPEGSILVVERLLPSDVVSLPKAKVAAVVVETLGQGSHAALLAREKGIPTITEIPEILSLVSSGTELLVDGFRGTLVIAPDLTTRSDFQERLEKWRATLVRCKAACRQPARTRDGQLIHVEANIGIHDDVELALDNGADGVGLLQDRAALLRTANSADRGGVVSRARKLDYAAGHSAGDRSPSRHRRRQAAPLFEPARNCQSRIGQPRRALASEILAAGPNSNGSDLGALQEALVARA